MPRFHTLDVDVQRNVSRFAIELFLQELAEQLHEPDDWQKAAANNAITAFHRGEHGHALTCNVVGETPPDQRSPLSTFTEGERGLSLRDLWRRFACARSVPVSDHFLDHLSPKSRRNKIGGETSEPSPSIVFGDIPLSRDPETSEGRPNLRSAVTPVLEGRHSNAQPDGDCTNRQVRYSARNRETMAGAQRSRPAGA